MAFARGPRRFDALAVAVLLIWALPDVPWWWRGARLPLTDPVVPGYLLLALAMSVPFWWQRKYPIPVFIVAVAVLMTRIELGKDDTAALAATLLAGYGVAAYSPTLRPYARRLGWLALIVAVVVEQLNLQYDRMAAVPVALFGAAILIGDARRGETAAAVEAAHLTERARIARELHDVLAHQLSAITIQSGAARLTATQREADPERLVEVLATVEELSREALAELGHLLGVLRKDADADPARRPVPGLGELDGLLAATRTGGVPVDLAIEGPARAVSPGLELSIYRIVQEALTNVARHAPGADTRVALRYAADSVTLDVVNGPARARTRMESGSAAHPHLPVAGVGAVKDVGPEPQGIRGMRERTELYGGRLAAGPRAGGGFAVTAEIPVGGREVP